MRALAEPRQRSRACTLRGAGSTPALGSIVAAALLAAAPLAAEQGVCTFSTAGLVKADLNLTLYQDFASVATTAVTVTELESRDDGTDYLIAGLTDVAAGSGTSYRLHAEYPGDPLCVLAWPFETRTPQAVVWAARYSVVGGTVDIRAGDTSPAQQLIVDGLAADPTGASVTFALYRLNGTPGTALAKSVSSLSRSGSTVTVDTTAAHGYSTGQQVVIAGASPTAYNGTQTITVSDADTFTYAVSGSPTTPATGTITASRAIVGMTASLIDSTAVVDPVTSDTSWRATVQYSWATGDTTSLAASGQATQYFGRYTITYAAATCGPTGDQPCIATWPPDRRAVITVHP